LPLGIIEILNCKRNLLYISVCRCRQTRIWWLENETNSSDCDASIAGASTIPY
jgi:hypothetical protein